MMDHTRSRTLFAEAQKRIPGGVNSPARAFNSVGGDPVFIARGDGASMFDADGNAYLDLVGSWGPLILGHRHPVVIDFLRATLDIGTSFGAPTAREIEIAELIAEIVPCVEMVRLVNSGTEATMSALRVARGFTGRDLAVKFIGNYHGHVDSLLVKAGSGLATLGISDSGGVPANFAKTTIALPFNDPEAVEKCFAERGDEIAAVIMEPVVGNMGCIPPKEGYLQAVRDITQKYGAVLIFDEVMCGFRVALGGAQERYGVIPDMVTLGKIIGGGLPVGAYGGRRDIMEKVSPLGPVYQAGTLSGNPLAVAGGLATLRLLQALPTIYDSLERKTAMLADGIGAAAKELRVPMTINRVGSMVTFFFHPGPVYDWDTASQSDTVRFAKFFRGMLERGIYLPCSQYEAAFLSDAWTEDDISVAVEAARESLAALDEESA